MLLLLVAALACGWTLLLWFTREGARAPASTAQSLPTPTGDTLRTDESQPNRAEALGESPVLETGPDRSVRGVDPTAASDQARDRFQGRGIIRGEVVTRGGVSFPEHWSLLVGPHPWLEGSQRAATRRVEFEHGERQFRVDDLPLGGYLVRASAGALNDVPANVLLVQGSTDQFVTLLFSPSGFIDGSVLDAAGRPAEGLDVTLESTETRMRSTITTDAAGTFLFRDVLDGEYALSFGRPDSPLLHPDSIAFRAPSLRFPTRTLPPTGALKILVVDESFRPQARVQVSGFAAGAGTIDGFSDHLGRLPVRYLRPGHYVIDARGEDGLEGSLALDLQAGQDAEVQVLVRARH